MTAGKLAIKPMFYQAIVTPSSEIKPMFGKIIRDGESINYELQQTPSRETEPMGAYVADLYLRGARNPYHTQTAGRELLESSVPQQSTLRADLAPTVGRP